MPSPRKRIGYLPGIEVQDIINKICDNNKYSQSKVTGILVEEALRARGFLNQSISEMKTVINNKDPLSQDDYRQFILKENEQYNFILNNNINNVNLDKSINTTSSEYQLFKEYLEFKSFKNMIKKSQKESLD